MLLIARAHHNCLYSNFISKICTKCFYQVSSSCITLGTHYLLHWRARKECYV
ncbi:hypothetical protein HMPREF3208_01099 [Gardnerella vaginalis]|uniref:Uncharacterized protein n=1 Tax=Gardnerella vaginalis TaxID=2702 RepID=A0A133NSJ3_GARVA|nr:hypothetical protein HMPREF3208_01099 [Gardnerella vaginalis]